VIRLQEQPFLVLAALLDRPGEVVTREELRERLWPSNSFGDFDQGLNTAINKVREALRDSAATPRFIETLPKRGYRFTHPLEPEAEKPPVVAVQAKRRWFAIPKLLLLIGTAVAIGALVAAIVSSRPPAQNSELTLRRFSIRALAPVGITHDVRVIAISPNGRHIAFVDGTGERKLWIQDIDQQDPRVVEGSAGAVSPFWSPDSSAVAFSTSSGTIDKVPAKGGDVVRLVDLRATHVSGGAWDPNGEAIVFVAGTPSSLYSIAASGGTPKLLMSPKALDSETDGWIMQPYFLPAHGGARTLLFTSRGSLFARNMETGGIHVIGTAFNVAYSPSGHLLYRSGADLWARPFSLKHARFEGEPFRVARNATDPSVALDGTLVYRDTVREQLVWLDRRGTRIGPVGQPASAIHYPALSPDDSRVGIEARDDDNVEARDNDNNDIWVSDVGRATRTRLTSHPSTDILPVWSPAGDKVAYSSYRNGNTDIFVRRADAAAEEIVLADGPYNERVSDWSPDGQYLLYSLQHPKNGTDLRILKTTTDGKWESQTLLETPFNERTPKLSPDGRYFAYLSDESGRDEVYVRPFPSGERKWPISTRGAGQIRWSPRSNELFYLEGNTLIAVSVRTTPQFAAGAASHLFSHTGFATVWDANYDVSQDGRRIILPEVVTTPQPMIRLVQNWFVARGTGL
jgi:Tol biopolymer transport system component